MLNNINPPTHGNSHRCECGRIWWESDGAPCHYRCIRCGILVGEDDEGWDNSEIGELCSECYNDIKTEEEDDEEDEDYSTDT